MLKMISLSYICMRVCVLISFLVLHFIKVVCFFGHSQGIFRNAETQKQVSCLSLSLRQCRVNIAVKCVRTYNFWDHFLLS